MSSVRTYGCLLSLALLASTSTAQSATLVELPLLPAPAGFSTTPRVAHLDSAGRVVGTLYFTRKLCPRCPTDVIVRSFLVVNGQATQIGPDGFVVTGANELGDVIGNWRNPLDAQLYPFLLRDGALIPLSSTPASVLDINDLGQISFLPAINDAGLFACMASDGEHGLHAFKYQDALPVDDYLCGSTSPVYECMTGASTGYDFVSDLNDGATVGESMAVGGDRDNPWYSSYGRQSAFVGYRGTTTYLSSGFTAAALAVNNRGEIVGYDDGRAVLWIPHSGGGWREVRIDDKVGDAHWVTSEASTVNDAGEVAGIGQRDGVPAAFLYLPPRPAQGGPHFR